MTSDVLKAHCLIRICDDDEDLAAALERLSQLTARETEIVKLIAAGLVSREIAERLGIALRTVEVHRAGALKKIGTHDPSAIKRLLETAGV